MFERLAHDVENLVVPVDGSALVELLAVRDRLDAVACEAVAAFDAAGRFELDGAVTMQAWLRDQAGMTSSAANRWVRTARRMARLPLRSRRGARRGCGAGRSRRSWPTSRNATWPASPSTSR